MPDHEFLDNGQSVGRIYEIRAPMRPGLLWFWSITVVGAYCAGIETDGRAQSFEDAKVEFKKHY
jgi:hypothetical protein